MTPKEKLIDKFITNHVFDKGTVYSFHRLHRLGKPVHYLPSNTFTLMEGMFGMDVKNTNIYLRKWFKNHFGEENPLFTMNRL